MSVERSGQRPAAGSPMGPMGRGAMGMPVQKAKDFRGTLKRFLGYFLPQKYRLIAVLVTAVIGTAFNIVGPKILGLATTKLFEGLVARFRGVPGAKIDFNYIGHVLLILAGLYIISSVFTYMQQYIMAGVAQRTVYKLREEVEAKLAHLPLKFFDSRTHGEILSRAVNDMDNISTTLQQSLTQLIISAVTLIGVIILMLTISPLLSLVVLITLPLSLVVTVGIAKRSQRYFAQQQRSLGELNGHVEEMYTGHKIVKAFGREGNSIEEFDRLNDKLYEA
nr:ABC transporter ATP-binding protein [Chloroflexota bacterium]